MATILSFLQLNQFVSNARNSTNPVGELSTKANTYSRDPQSYFGNNSILIVFYKDLLSAESALADVILNSVANILDNFNTVYSSLNSGNKLNDVIGTLDLTAHPYIDNVIIGPLVYNPINAINYPQWISFTYFKDGHSFEFKVWLASETFESEYPKGEITVVGPIDNYSGLFTSFDTVKASIQNVSYRDLHDRLTSVVTWIDTKDEYIDLVAYNPYNANDSFTISFSVSYNGGSIYCNTKNFLEAILDYLKLRGGNRTKEEWLVIIPGLSPVSRFFVIPNWENTAIVNVSQAAPIYSPTVNVKSLYAHIENLITTKLSGPLSGSLDYINYLVAVYKSIGVFVIPTINEALETKPIKAIHSDYFISLIGDINVNQMLPSTQNFVVTLDRVLRLAEGYKDNDVLPNGYSLEVYNGLKFIKTRVPGLELIVLTRLTKVDLI